MIEQELYIEILELFDLIYQEEIFIEYCELERKLLTDEKVVKVVNNYNEINTSLAKVTFASYQLEQEKQLQQLKQQLLQNKDYQRYQELYDLCNKRLNYLSSLIFKDIIIVKETGCHGCY